MFINFVHRQNANTKVHRLEYAAFTETGTLFLKHQVSMKAK